jgi:FtsP/CotA-like multicopper oxidase with cupredoxin domain
LHVSLLLRLVNTVMQTDETMADEIMLVNGQSNPVMDVESGVWYRWRTMFIGTDSYFAFQFDDPLCSMHLLGKDGVYLEVAPRFVPELPLYAGARADIAVQCTGPPRTVHLTAFPNNDGFDFQIHLWEGNVLTLNVLDGGAVEAPLPLFRVNRPCYLATTISDTPSVVLDPINLGGGTFGINLVRFPGEGQFIDTMPVGALVEWAVSGIRGHPFHLHINHFQIVASPEQSPYFQVGDWHGEDHCAPCISCVTTPVYLSHFRSSVMHSARRLLYVCGWKPLSGSHRSVLY